MKGFFFNYIAMNKHHIIIILVLIIFVATFTAVHYRILYNNLLQEKPDTIRTTFRDSIPYYYPVPKDSVIIKYKVINVPAASDVQDTTDNQDIVVERDSCSHDSFRLRIPVTQKKYRTDDYTIYISGYRPVLDSAFISRTETFTTIHNSPMKKKWTVGISAGAGMTPKGLQPFIGVTITRRLFDF